MVSAGADRLAARVKRLLLLQRSAAGPSPGGAAPAAAQGHDRGRDRAQDQMVETQANTLAEKQAKQQAKQQAKRQAKQQEQAHAATRPLQKLWKSGHTERQQGGGRRIKVLGLHGWGMTGDGLHGITR